MCGTGCAGGAFGALGPLARAAGGGAGVGEAAPPEGTKSIQTLNVTNAIKNIIEGIALLCFALLWVD